MMSWGLSFDWAREVNTTDPDYYKWTQWIFLEFYKAGLAYEATGVINWCPKDKTGLANEEVVGGKCDRCGETVEKKELRQWYLKITAYAEKLLEGLKNLPEWPEPVKLQQENWIGKSEGAEIDFEVEAGEIKESVTVFTTRPDTLFGATYLVLSPDGRYAKALLPLAANRKEAEDYAAASKGKSEEERVAAGKAKTGVELKGISAVNPANGERIPVWISDYVLSSYGTGAIMAVPAHDERDFEFAEEFGLPKRVVVSSGPAQEPLSAAVEASGILVNSGRFNGLDSEKAKWEITEFVRGRRKTQYKLRDWVFSRQRYWGEPIPLVHCPECGVVPVPEKDLPVKLPKVKKYEPTGTGESPLAAIEKWVNTKCPNCKGKAKRETNTMPQWAGSSWYWLRYADPKNKKEFADKKKLEYWTPVDVYFGGMEHTTLHLLYSRFWNLFLYDRGLVSAKEPYKKRQPHGIILASDGEKMSKSRGNVVNPDAIVERFGADALRMYEMFLGPHEMTVSWNDQGILGVKRFLDRTWKLVVGSSRDGEDGFPATHKAIKKVGEDIENFRYNTAISALMILLNELEEKGASLGDKKALVLLLAPFAPHISEELWKMLKPGAKSVHLEPWPEYDPALSSEKFFNLVIQVNGKTKAVVEMPFSVTEAEAKARALAEPKVEQALGKAEAKKIIYVPGRLINIVI
jgi:leucyl-tRNA synthetase